VKRPFDDLRRLRAERHVGLAELPNVIGTGVGYKRTAGAVSRTPALVVFVSRKAPPGDLSPDQRIPARAHCQGTNYPPMCG
jgi:hypothetical protein